VNKTTIRVIDKVSMISNTLNLQRLRSLLLTAILGILSSCGGEGGVPEGGGTGSIPPDTPVVAIGPLTKTSPPTVNGLTLNTTSATITTIEALDDDGSGLQVGMMVRVEGQRTAAPGQARVTRITSGAELRGVVQTVDRATQVFTSNGVAIDVNSATRFDGFAEGLASMQATDVVQVHGYPSGSNRILATLVRKRAPTTELKLTGNVSGLDEATFCSDCKAISQDFRVGNLVIRPARGTVATDSLDITNGALVKVEGFFDAASGVFIATGIKRYEGPPPQEGDSVALQGVYATAGKDFKDFTISGVPVRVNETTKIIDTTRFGATLAPGNVLDVEGLQEGGGVTATKVIRR
jgi:Domain of unknown function (DUF5666)